MMGPTVSIDDDRELTNQMADFLSELRDLRPVFWVVGPRASVNDQLGLTDWQR